MPYTSYSDSYLMNMNKLELIELLRCAEHNYFAMEEALNNATNAGKEIAEKYDEAKRLLRVAVKDLNNLKVLYRWRYADEAEKLLDDKI